MLNVWEYDMDFRCSYRSFMNHFYWSVIIHFSHLWILSFRSSAYFCLILISLTDSFLTLILILNFILHSFSLAFSIAQFEEMIFKCFIWILSTKCRIPKYPQQLFRSKTTRHFVRSFNYYMKNTTFFRHFKLFK